ncbi:ABC transporter [Capsaspora owczarzaki ATCC 30864]|uniref:ABC transporter n=1 Tax=Capsaspora owczarzaki (strain ATCC 30864) TaxID=595528 RepID=A0A0D2X435_CAPO3|nr:ABC transporter [Capsaspora owczarzaki ATCC 30864]KJE95369.1 ABC transporter [Capsaspora owczarzaki ATCC 30864]|eukprot:XP_004345412.1 ABC transporter [Capsaspora owczarzaki ATCC 30864]
MADELSPAVGGESASSLTPSYSAAIDVPPASSSSAAAAGVTAHANAGNARQVTLAWRNLGVNVPLKVKRQAAAAGAPTSKRILQDVSGMAQPGQLLAIMGPSGSGKTTLLNILSGRSDDKMRVEGDILINGSPMEKRHRRVIGYVRQSDVHFNNLTCREILSFSANIRLPTELSVADRHQRVEAIIDELGLRKCADTIVGGNLIRGISGGEKKRLSVGVELITSPSLLFLDEPTSGLDSHMAYTLFEHLDELKKSSKRTVVTTIHQPSSKLFSTFDLLLLLSEGRVFYFGPVADAITYFSKTCRLQCPVYSNPAEYFLDVASIRLHPHMSQELGYPTTDENGQPLPTLNWDLLVSLYEKTRQDYTLKSIEEARVRCLAEQQVIQAEMEARGLTVRKRSRFGFANSRANSSATVAVQQVEMEDLQAEAMEKGNGHANGKTNGHAGAAAAAAAQQNALAELAPEVLANLTSNETYAQPTWYQFQVLARRSFMSFIRDKRYFRARIMQVIIMSVLIGIIFLRLPYSQAGVSARSGGIFFLMMQAGISPMMNILHVFHAEREVITHERDGKWYTCFAYYAAKSITELPFQLLEPLLFTVIAYWLMGLNDSAERFFGMIGIMMLTSLCGSSFGLMLAASTPSFQVATIFASLMMMFLILFSGFFVLNDLIPIWLRWIKYISFMYYSFGLLLQNEFSGGSYYCEPSEFAPNHTCPITTGAQALQNLGAADTKIGENIIILVALIVAARTVCFLALRHYKPKGVH